LGSSSAGRPGRSVEGRRGKCRVRIERARNRPGVPERARAGRPILQQLFETWRFDDWKEISLLIDGEKALLHWTARVTCVPTGKTENFDALDLITFHDGEIVDYHQSTDTALMMSLAAA
jgi:ketosteroid isomerase-like protein